MEKLKKCTIDDYYKLTGDKRAELINSEIYYMASPSRIHQELVHYCSYELENYIRSKGGDCRVYPAPFDVNLFNDESTIVEPDVFVVCDKNKLTQHRCNGAPDLIIEVVSPSTKSRDYFVKLNLYRLAGVREYWIVNPMAGSVNVYYFEDESDNFDIKHYTLQDKVKVNIFNELDIDFSKM